MWAVAAECGAGISRAGAGQAAAGAGTAGPTWNAVEADAAANLLRALKNEFSLTVVCIEHLMRIIMTVSDRVVVLDRGAVIANGTPAEVADNPQVQRAYLGNEYA